MYLLKSPTSLFRKTNLKGTPQTRMHKMISMLAWSSESLQSGRRRCSSQPPTLSNVWSGYFCLHRCADNKNKRSVNLRVTHSVCSSHCPSDSQPSDGSADRQSLVGGAGEVVLQRRHPGDGVPWVPRFTFPVWYLSSICIAKYWEKASVQ